MQQLPIYINFVFILTTIITILMFYLATQKSTPVLATGIAWLLLQSLIASTGFYTFTENIPPRFLLLILPPFLTITLLFVTKAGRRFLDSWDRKILTLLHTVRIPVELVLYWLCLQKMVPAIMTFEGRNFDILSGLSAVIIYYYCFIKKVWNKKVMLVWNFACLLLLINIVVTAILSAPFPFQQFAFDQPNIAVLYFPFISLPCFIVPVVFVAHLATIRQILIIDSKHSIK